MRCDICRGEQVVRLQVVKELSLDVMSASIPMELDVAYRIFPCPQCSEQVGIGVLRTCFHETTASQYRLKREPTFQDRVRDGLAHNLADQLLNDNLIRFEERPSAEFNPLYGSEGGMDVRATIVVCPSDRIDTLEAKIAERQYEMADQVTRVALGEIELWGSQFEVNHLSKAQASRLVRSSLEMVKRHRSEWRKSK